MNTLPNALTKRFLALLALLLITLSFVALTGCQPAASEAPERSAAVQKQVKPPAEALRDGEALGEIDRFFAGPLGVPVKTN